MDDFPDHLIVEILSRLNDSTELGRCKCVSKTLNSLARQVRSIHLYCSLDRYTKMRSPETMKKVTPFKTIFHKLISDAEVPIESVSLGVEEPLNCFINEYENYDEHLEDVSDDLFLSDDVFIAEWLKKIGDRLKSILIWDFRAQAYGRLPNLFDLVSYSCQSLVELEVQNAYLTVNDMRLMPLLTRLTLKYIKLFYESLNKLMECLPCLQVLNIIDSFDIDTVPNIRHLNLKELKWTLSNCSDTSDLSSLVIFAPSLTKLELDCERPITLSIHAPLLSYFDLALERTKELCVDKFENLKTLRLVSWELHYKLSTFPSARTVQNLIFDSFQGPDYNRLKFSLLDVLTIFPNVTSLTLGYEVWSQQMAYPSEPLAKRPRATYINGLKHITIYLVLGDIVKALTFIFYVLGICSNLTDIVLFIRHDVDFIAASSFVSLCMTQCPRVRLRWGTWKAGTNGHCISSSIFGAANTVCSCGALLQI